MNGMKIKSYFAKTVDEAIAKARVELGSDALLLNTRKVADAGNGAGYEVVMGVSGPAPARETKTNVPPAAKTPGQKITAAALETAAKPASGMGTELEKLRVQMDELQSLLMRSARNSWAAQRLVSETVQVYEQLIAADVDPALSKDIADRLEAAMATDAFFLHTGPDAQGAQNRWKALKSDPERVEKFLRAELESRIALRPRLGVNGAKSVVAAVVGPTGSGKTTSLAKLAIAASAQRPVRLISLDQSRIGAEHLLDSLKTPAITFSTVKAMEDLPKLVREARKKECVLIDTPGYSPQDRPAAEALAAAFASCADVDVHLVLPAYMKSRDLRNSIERYALFQPGKLLVTRLDETELLGTVFSEAAIAGLALSFLSHGARIPDDIRAAKPDDLLAMVEPKTRARAASQRAA